MNSNIKANALLFHVFDFQTYFSEFEYVRAFVEYVRGFVEYVRAFFPDLRNVSNYFKLLFLQNSALFNKILNVLKQFNNILIIYNHFPHF